MKKDKNLIIAAEMGALTAEMNHYNNSVEVYSRYLEKRNDPNEDQYIVECILECVERYMKIRGVDYQEMLEEQHIIKEFIMSRASVKKMTVEDYCKKFGLRYNIGTR